VEAVSIDLAHLMRVSVRRVPTAAIVGAGVVAAAAVTARAVSADDASELLQVARLSALVVAASATSAVDDPSAPLTDTTWRGRRYRAALVLAPTALLASATWCVPVVVADGLVPGPRLPIRGLLVELLVLTGVGWLFTASISRSRGPRGAPLAGATLLMLATLATMTTPRTVEWLWRSPDPAWLASHVRWSSIGVVSGFALASVWRDPAR
jgi:hypothetical protein